MMCLTMCEFQQIRIGKNIFIHCKKSNGDQIRVYIDAPIDIKVNREEKSDYLKRTKNKTIISFDRAEVNHPAAKEEK